MLSHAAGQLTVDLAGAPELLRTVPGTGVRFACITDVGRVIDGPRDPEDPAIATARQTWPAGQAQLTVTLSRSLAGADVCGLEDAGVGDHAWVAFTPAGEDAMGQREDEPAGQRTARRRLKLASKAALADAVSRRGGHYARPRKLARVIRAMEPALRVAFAAALHDVRRERVVYVLAASTRTVLRLAYRTPAGALVRFRHDSDTQDTRILIIR